VPGGAAARAGLREGDVLDLPSYPELLRLEAGAVLDVGLDRDGEALRVAVPLTGETAPVPQWRAVSRRPSSPAP
jgi:hypothetical protein